MPFVSPEMMRVQQFAEALKLFRRPLLDGTQLDGVDSIRQRLLDDTKIFTRCLPVKFLQYGAGRELSAGGATSFEHTLWRRKRVAVSLGPARL